MRKARDGALWVLSVTERAFQVRRRMGESWHLAFELQRTASENVRGFSEVRGRPVIISETAALTIAPDGRQVSQRLAARDGLEASVAVEATDDGDVYLGFDRGEWGGGVQRVRFDGTDAGIPSSPNLDARVDPIRQLVADPLNGACVYAVGAPTRLVTRALVLKICGSKVDRVLERKGAFIRAADIRALAVDRDTLFAVGDGEVYVVRGTHESIVATSAATTRCGLTVATAPRLWLVSLADLGDGERLLALLEP